MSWLRYSDDFIDWSEWDMATPEAFWAYVILVQTCSRGQYWDGRLPLRKARAALLAHLDDPDEPMERLALLSLLHVDRPGGVVIVPRIAEHVPPKGMRDNAKNARERMRRKRARDKAEAVSNSPVTRNVTRHVTARVTVNTGTGRDGTKRRITASENDGANPLEAAPAARRE